MVYLIHFDKPYRHAQHYIGYTVDLDHRIYDHQHNVNGARLLQVVRNTGINFRVVRTWPEGDRTFERRLKNRKNARKLCPVCRMERKIKNA